MILGLVLKWWKGSVCSSAKAKWGACPGQPPFLLQHPSKSSVAATGCRNPAPPGPARSVATSSQRTRRLPQRHAKQRLRGKARLDGGIAVVGLATKLAGGRCRPGHGGSSQIVSEPRRLIALL